MTNYWKSFIDDHGLRGREICFSKATKGGSIEHGIEILSDEKARQEDEEACPGIFVRKDGFRAVGGDAHGSGDQYFINERDGVGGPLYRIYHDCVFDEKYDRVKAVELVLPDYRELLRHEIL